MNRRNNLPKRLKLKIKNQTALLELKNSINEMKNALESIGYRAEHSEERISDGLPWWHSG